MPSEIASAGSNPRLARESLTTLIARTTLPPTSTTATAICDTVKIVRRHGRPAEGRHSVQVEINKRLYMSEETLQRHAGFEQVRQTLREMVEALLVQDLGLDSGAAVPVAAYFGK